MTTPEHVRGVLARLIERHRRAAHDRPEAGDTLIEILLALVVIGITVTALLGAFATTISASAEQRNLSQADAFMRSFVDTATYQISLSTSPAPVFVACASSVPTAYSTIATNYSAAPSTFNVAFTGISAPPNGCSATNPSLQQLTVKVTSKTGGTSDSTTFVVYPPSATLAAISTSVTSLSPSAGPAAGGTTVTISGNGFNGITAVKFGTTAATSYTRVSATQITAVSPPGTGVVDVTVSTSAGTSPTNPLDQFTYAPTVTAVAPSSGSVSGGTPVTITGTGFIGASSVKFGLVAVAATNYTVVSSSQITALSPTPLLAGTVDITVTTIGGTSATSSADQFTYAPTTVSGVSPNSGPQAGGTVVTISGSGFTGATSVKFGTSAATAVTVSSDTSITATSPAGTGTVDVTVTTPTGTSATNISDRFTYNAGTAVGLGLVIQTGSKNPVTACASGQGAKCSSPNSSTCMMTSSSATTCDISGIWQGPNNTSVSFFLETVDANGNPVNYSTTNSLSLTVNSATPTSISIPKNTSSTSPSAVTATLTSNNSTNTVTITGGGWTFTVVVSS